MLQSRQNFVEEAVGKAGGETEMERDAVVSGDELGLWDAEMQPTDEDCPLGAGS